MKKSAKLLKRICCVACALAICAFAATSDTTEFTLDAHASISSIKDDIEKLRQQQNQLKNEIESTRNNASLEKENQAAISQQIQTTNETISLLDEYIASLEGSIETLEGSIAEQEADIAQKEIEIDEGIDNFKKRIRALYVSGNTSMAEILMNSSDFYDMLMRTELMTRVAEHDDKMISDLLQLRNDYEVALQLLEEDKTSLEAEKLDYEAQCDEWNENLLYLNDLMNQSDAVLAEYEREEAAIKSQLEELQRLEREREQELENAIQAAAAANRPYVGGTFTWPVPGFYTITSGVGVRWGSYHKGIDISSSGIAGAPIVAANGGTVIKVANSCQHNYGKYSNCCGNGYGRYVMIDHGGGYVTLYAHMTNALVYEGQTVERGETIGTVGTTGHSTGYHLHFEVRLNSNIQNPMDYFTR